VIIVYVANPRATCATHPIIGTTTASLRRLIRSN
ncbi:MAG: hypothetical protein QOJ61_2056, partial [Mycobacterium sp.]|nr:hypothetical protein [Mycobacterium sp.]